MKAKSLTLLVLVLLSSLTYAQQETPQQRASPPDSAQTTTEDGVHIQIHYSSPALKNREIGVDVAEVGNVWRTGANEATTVEFDKDVLINGNALSAGKYSLYSIPDEHSTTIIFNKVWDQWGTEYDESQDALRFTVSNETNTESQERFQITADPSGLVYLAWGQYALSFHIKASS